MGLKTTFFYFSYLRPMLPSLLHIESSTDICSIAVSRGEEMIGFSETTKAYQHASQMTLLIDQAMAAAKLRLAELSAVSVSLGPGSYTSLRVGFSTAKGICYALDKPLITVPSLQAIAQAISKQPISGSQALSTTSDTLYVPMIDARRMEVYLAMYDQDIALVKEPQAVVIEESIFATYMNDGAHLVLGGNGAPKCQAVLQHPQIHFVPVLASAQHLISLAYLTYQEEAFADLAYVEPFYLKPPNITVSKKKLL